MSKKHTYGGGHGGKGSHLNDALSETKSLPEVGGDLPEVASVGESELPEVAPESPITLIENEAPEVEPVAPVVTVPAEPKPARVPGAKNVSDYGTSPMHHAARVLHKWDEYAHHHGKEMQLLPEDYKAAILAASKRKTVVVKHEGNRKTVTKFYEPHAPALFDLSKMVADNATAKADKLGAKAGS